MYHIRMVLGASTQVVAIYNMRGMKHIDLSGRGQKVEKQARGEQQ